MSSSESPKPFVSIVVANWQGEQYLARCLSSLQISARRSGFPFEIIVVDDASSDRSLQIIRDSFPSVRLVPNRENQGFARTINRGARAARGPVLLLANNDIVAREEFVGSLVRWFSPDTPARPKGAERGPLFAVSAKTVGWYDGRPNQLCMGAVWKGGRITPAWSNPALASPCLFAQAGAAAYDRKLFRQLGGLSRLYEPGYWEDYDLSWRAARMGWQQLYDPGAFALHVGGGSMTRRFGAEGVAAMKTRNHLLFEATNLRSPALISEWAGRMPLRLARDENRRFSRAFMETLARMPEILKVRYRTRGLVSDLKLLEPWRNFTPSF